MVYILAGSAGASAFPVAVARYADARRTQTSHPPSRCLKTHVDPAVEPSKSVRCIFGELFTPIVWMAPAWATTTRRL